MIANVFRASLLLLLLGEVFPSASAFQYGKDRRALVIDVLKERARTLELGYGQFMHGFPL